MPYRGRETTERERFLLPERHRPAGKEEIPAEAKPGPNWKISGSVIEWAEKRTAGLKSQLFFLMICEKYPELRYKYRNREFWCRGYYVDTAGKNAKKIQEYIQKQLEEDKAGEQLTMGNF